MQTKACSKCKVEKPLSDFYKDKRGQYGVRGDCKKCSSSVAKRTPDQKRKSDQKYKQSEKGKLKRQQYVKENAEKLRESGRLSYRRNRDRYLEYWKKRRVERKDEMRSRVKSYENKYPERKKAKDAVAIAIRRGDMKPATDCSCSLCHQQAHEYHHPSYEQSQWLAVVPLCRSCHRRVHKSKNYPPLSEIIAQNHVLPVV